MPTVLAKICQESIPGCFSMDHISLLQSFLQQIAAKSALLYCISVHLRCLQAGSVAHTGTNDACYRQRLLS